MIDRLIDRHMDYLDSNKMDIGLRHLIIQNTNCDVIETNTTFATGFQNFQLGARHPPRPSYRHEPVHLEVLIATVEDEVQVSGLIKMTKICEVDNKEHVISVIGLVNNNDNIFYYF